MTDDEARANAQRMNDFFRDKVPGLLGMVCDYAERTQMVLLAR